MQVDFDQHFHFQVSQIDSLRILTDKQKEYIQSFLIVFEF